MPDPSIAWTQCAVLDDARRLLSSYLRRHPGDAARLPELTRRLEREPDGLLSRACMAGHLTASMLVLDPTRTRALVILHKAIGLWIQPGGHYEAPGGLLDSALREVAEETGLVRVTPHPAEGEAVPLDIDTHPIAANPKRGEGDHLHHDFCWLGIAEGGEETVAQVEEVDGVAWRPLDALIRDPNLRTARLAARALAAASGTGPA